MEIVLRCAVPDRPGALAELAGVIAGCGCDIESVDVVDVADGVALDDLVVVVEGPRHLRALLDALAEVPELSVVHAAPSRGHPGDAVTRFAVGLESILTGAMDAEHGVRALVGGLLRADEVELVAVAEQSGEHVLAMPYGTGHIVARRSYPFSQTEMERARALVRVCARAAEAGDPGGGPTPTTAARAADDRTG